MFRSALNPQLAHRILFGETIPKTIQEWYDKAIQFDTNYRDAMNIMGGGRNYSSSWRDNRDNHDNRPSRRNPNAMDVDTLTTNK
jgi:hypothetical protein